MRSASHAYLADREVNRSESTYAGDRTAMKYLLAHFAEESAPADVTAPAMKELFNNLLRLKYRPSTVAQLRSHLVQFFDFAQVDPNPARAAKVPASPREDVVPWYENELKAIRDAADEIDAEQGGTAPSRRLLVEYLLGSGARIQEAAAVRWEHIDRLSRTVRIAKQISRKSRQPTHTKGRKPRSVTMMPEWWDFHQDSARGLIFPAPDGRAIAYRKLYDYVVEILERAELKLPGQAAHQFRHTYAFHFLERGGGLERLQKCLGHKKLRTTEEYYDHFTSDHAAKAAAEQIYAFVLRGPRAK